MGPHSSECGNASARPSASASAKTLQWGRTHLSAETSIIADVRPPAFKLQWGPHSSECGNQTAAGTLSWVAELQWGRTHLSAETRCHRIPTAWLPKLQWGRTHLSAETCRDRAAAMRRSRFNGAALI